MMLAKTNHVDFSEVEQKHAAIDARLVNWARWANNRAGPGSSPMFRLYRSTEVYEPASSAPPVDSIDAQKVQKAVSALPTQNRLALSWSYIKRTNPRQAAQSLGLSLDGLRIAVRDGRQMLCNRA